MILEGKNVFYVRHGYHGLAEVILPAQAGFFSHVQASSLEQLALTDENLKFQKGKARALEEEESNCPYYEAVDFRQKSRGFDDAWKERIKVPVEKRIIGTKETGKFDDRKWRVDSVKPNLGYPRKSNPAEIFLGPTHFNEYQDHDVKACLDVILQEKMVERGLKEYQDPRAYFANPLAVSTVLETSDGQVIVCKRNEQAKLLPGYWSHYAGFVDADFSLMEKPDGSKAIYNSIFNAMKEELQEEGKIEHRDICKMRMTGLVWEPTSYDFTFITETLLPAEEVFARHKRAVDREENPNLKALRTLGEVADFLTDPNVKMAGAARGGLFIYVGVKDPQMALDVLEGWRLREDKKGRVIYSYG